MLSLPIAYTSVIGIFVPVFSRPVWQHVKVLLTGAILAPGKRTVTAILQIMGRSAAPDFQTYHRVLNRAVWSPLTASRLLLRFLVAVFLPPGVIVCSLDDTICAPPRRADESQRHLPRPGMLLARASGQSQWPALPLLTVLCPSERFYAQRSRRYQPLTERARQIIRLVVRWLQSREIALVADSSFAALELLDHVKTVPRASMITRLRLDAALSDLPPPRPPGTKGRPRLKGKRRPTLEAVLADEQARWTTVLVEQWYGKGPREVEITTDTAVWITRANPSLSSAGC